MKEGLVSSFLAHPPSFNDLNTGVSEHFNEHFHDHEALPEAPASAPEMPRAGSIRHNKADPAWPKFDGLDLHKIDVADHTRDKTKFMDHGVGKPSIWEEHIKSQQYMAKSKDTPVQIHSANPRVNPVMAEVSRMAYIDQNRNKGGAAERTEPRMQQDDNYSDMIQHFGTE